MWLAAACFCLLAVQTAGAGQSPTVASLQAQDAQLAGKSRAAVLDLYSIDERLATAQSRLGALQADEVNLRRERFELGHELGLARLDAHLSQSRLASRLRFLYEHGGASSLDIVMGASTLGDALTQLDDFHRVAQSNAAVLLEVRLADRRLTSLRRELASRERSLVLTTQDAAATVEQLTQLRDDQASYVASLATQRSLDAAKVAQLTAEAQAAVVKSQTLVPAAAPSSTLTSAPVTAGGLALPAVGAQGVSSSGQKTLTVSATAYDLPGHTATGLPVGWGVAAVDPSVIPLGTHFNVPGYGEAVAADTGGAVVGDTIDLWFPTAAQADAWGRRTVTIALN